MANYATLKAAISAAIKQNGNNEITGILLQQQLLAMVNSLGVGYQYAGIATPATNPGTPDQNVFYLAGPGTYQNFDGTTIPDAHIGVLKYNGSWEAESLQVGETTEIVNDLITGGTNKALSAEMGKVLYEGQTILTKIVKNEDFVLNSGYLAASAVGQTAIVTTGSGLRYSDPVAVSAGDIVVVKSQGTSIACIATTDANGSAYIAKAISNDGSIIKTYTYVVEADGYIAISSRVAALYGEIYRRLPIAHIVEQQGQKIDTLDGAVAEIHADFYRDTEQDVDVTSEYTITLAQKYGTVGNVIRTYNEAAWNSTKILKTDGITRVVGKNVNSGSVSSLVQYVDDNDIIIALDFVSPSANQSYDFAPSFPTGATGMYVSGAAGTLKIYKFQRVLTPTIGDLNELGTLNKDTVVDAINEIESIYPTVEKVNHIGDYTLSSGQSYGNIGSTIQTSVYGDWRHIIIQKIDDIAYVMLRSLSMEASSLIQYVDDNDIIIALDATKGNYSKTEAREYRLTWPNGATRVYVSGAAGSLAAYQLEKAKGVGGVPLFRFRYLSWNVGHWAKGNATQSAVTADTYAETKAGFRKVMNDYAPDFVGCCEYSSIFYQTETARDALFCQYLEAEIGVESGYVGTALFSNAKLTDVQDFVIGGYRAMEGHIKAGGKDIIICECHLPWQSFDSNKAAIQQLIARYSDAPYVVIAGDMNFTSGREEELVALLTAAGYQNANWGYLGKILTSYNNVVASNFLDNIAVKGGSILKTQVLQNTPEGADPDDPSSAPEEQWDAVNLSDHFPIICDIEF